MRIPRDNYWRSDYPQQQGWFREHQTFLDQLLLPDQTWPTADCLNKLWQISQSGGSPKTESGLELSFVAQNDIIDQASYYEQHIYNTGHIPTREQNWHDYFNALIWTQFPEAKSALNALHVQEMSQQQEFKTRSRKRDALTLFDETGMILISSDQGLLDAHKEHDWVELFIRNRDQWWWSISVIIFGHGLLEKSLNPYIGMTGNALHIKVDKVFFRESDQQQKHILDQTIADQLSSNSLLEHPYDLTPLPMLGVPSWWPDNQQATFYQNTDYFRPKRKKKVQS